MNYGILCKASLYLRNISGGHAGQARLSLCDPALTFSVRHAPFNDIAFLASAFRKHAAGHSVQSLTSFNDCLTAMHTLNDDVLYSLRFRRNRRFRYSIRECSTKSHSSHNHRKNACQCVRHIRSPCVSVTWFFKQPIRFSSLMMPSKKFCDILDVDFLKIFYIPLISLDILQTRNTRWRIRFEMYRRIRSRVFRGYADTSGKACAAYPTGIAAKRAYRCPDSAHQKQKNAAYPNG